MTPKAKIVEVVCMVHKSRTCALPRPRPVVMHSLTVIALSLTIFDTAILNYVGLLPQQFLPFGVI